MSEILNLPSRSIRSKYDPEVADQILELVSGGKSMAAACREIGIHHMVPWLWARHDRDGFRDKLMSAREASADIHAEDIVRIADGQLPVLDIPDIEAQDPDLKARLSEARLDELNSAEFTRLRISARQWYVGKIAPRKYGDKVEVTHQGGAKPVEHVHGLMTDEEAARRYSENARRIGNASKV